MKQQWKRAAAFFLSICLLFSVMPVTASAAVSDDVRISISDMTTEYMANPIGIETDSVHFGWSPMELVRNRRHIRFRLQRAAHRKPYGTAAKLRMTSLSVYLMEARHWRKVRLMTGR